METPHDATTMPLRRSDVGTSPSSPLCRFHATKHASVAAAPQSRPTTVALPQS